MSALHQHIIERSLAELNANAPFQRCLLDATLHCEGPTASAAMFDSPATYRGADAALDLVLRRPAAQARRDTQTADPLASFAITVLLTDGFQSTVSPSTGGATDVSCAGGADPACLGSLLAARAREGYGVWVGRIYMPFAGTYFPERPIDELWPRVEAHVQELNTNHPEWTGVSFAAQRGRHASPSGAFRWEGARPLLIFVLTRDIALGRNFVAKVTEHLPTEPAIFARRPDVDVAFAELAPFAGASARVVESSIQRAGADPAARSVRMRPATRSARGVEVAIECPIEGVASFPVQAALTRPPLVPRWVDVVPSWRPLPPTRPDPTPAAAWVRPTMQPNSLNLNVGVDCRRVPQGQHQFSLGIHVDWRRNAQFNEQWFIRDSVETSVEAPERAYRLREIVTPPLVAATTRSGWLDQLHITLTRR